MHRLWRKLKNMNGQIQTKVVMGLAVQKYDEYFKKVGRYLDVA